MARMLVASLAAMLLTTIGSPGWSQAPTQPLAPGGSPGQPPRPQIETMNVQNSAFAVMAKNPR